MDRVNLPADGNLPRPPAMPADDQGDQFVAPVDPVPPTVLRARASDFSGMWCDMPNGWSVRCNYDWRTAQRREDRMGAVARHLRHRRIGVIDARRTFRRAGLAALVPAHEHVTPLTGPTVTRLMLALITASR